MHVWLCTLYFTVMFLKLFVSDNRIVWFIFVLLYLDNPFCSVYLCTFCISIIHLFGNCFSFGYSVFVRFILNIISLKHNGEIKGTIVWKGISCPLYSNYVTAYNFILYVKKYCNIYRKKNTSSNGEIHNNISFWWNSGTRTSSTLKLNIEQQEQFLF
jgi:hypothetical protein